MAVKSSSGANSLTVSKPFGPSLMTRVGSRPVKKRSPLTTRGVLAVSSRPLTSISSTRPSCQSRSVERHGFFLTRHIQKRFPSRTSVPTSAGVPARKAAWVNRCLSAFFVPPSRATSRISSGRVPFSKKAMVGP